VESKTNKKNELVKKLTSVREEIRKLSEEDIKQVEAN
jgi:hypothetical protein